MNKEVSSVLNGKWPFYGSGNKGGLDRDHEKRLRAQSWLPQRPVIAVIYPLHLSSPLLSTFLSTASPHSLPPYTLPFLFSFSCFLSLALLLLSLPRSNRVIPFFSQLMPAHAVSLSSDLSPSIFGPLYPMSLQWQRQPSQRSDPSWKGSIVTFPKQLDKVAAANSF